VKLWELGGALTAISNNNTFSAGLQSFFQKIRIIGTAVHVRSKKPGFFAWGMPLAPFKHPFASTNLLAEGQKNRFLGFSLNGC
jgi:hypothetical protein